MMRSGQILFAAGMLCIGGCATRGNVELLESQLRKREDQLYAIQSQLDQTEGELTVAQKEVDTLRGQLAERGRPALLPEQLQSLSRVKEIQVNKLLTGGLDRDGQPGDDILNVVLVPQDEHGEPVRLPGSVELEVIDLSAPADSRQVGVWRFSSEEVAKQWPGGLSAGFQFQIPWHGRTASQNLLLHARFGTADGRQFDTSTDIRITPGQSVDAGSLAEQPLPPIPSQEAGAVPLAPEPGFFAGGAGETLEPSHPTKVLRVTDDEGIEQNPPIQRQSATERLTEEDFFPMEAPEPVMSPAAETDSQPGGLPEDSSRNRCRSPRSHPKSSRWNRRAIRRARRRPRRVFPCRKSPWTSWNSLPPLSRGNSRRTPTRPRVWRNSFPCGISAPPVLPCGKPPPTNPAIPNPASVGRQPHDFNERQDVFFTSAIMGLTRAPTGGWSARLSFQKHVLRRVMGFRRGS